MADSEKGKKKPPYSKLQRAGRAVAMTNVRAEHLAGFP